MKYIKIFEAQHHNINLIHLAGIQQNEKKALKVIKELLKNGADINFQNPQDNNDSALIKAAYFDNYIIVDYLIKKGADWTLTDTQKCDFWFFLDDNMKKVIQNKYPDKYADYLLKKTANKYNL